MWTRKQLKQYAKQVLHGSYWKCLLVSVVLALLSNGFIGGVMHSSFHMHIGEWEATVESGFPALWSWIAEQLSVVLIRMGWIRDLWVWFAFIAAVSLLAAVFVILPLQVGKARYYLHHAYQKASFRDVFSVFTDGHYLHVVWVMLVRDIKIVLWTLCFIFPGIYKAYQYYMIPYLLAEDSTLSCKRVFAISKELTKEQKFDIFVLNLSFIGWLFLGALLFGVGQIFADPYCSATYTELYLARRSVYGKESG